MTQKQSADDTSKRICVGVISGAFGVKGDVRIKSFCATPEAIASYAPLFITKQSPLSSDAQKDQGFSLKITRSIAGGFAARLSNVTTKENADALRGAKIYAERSKLPVLPDDEFYHADLIGLAAYDTGGRHIGLLQSIHNHGAGDIIEILSPHTKQPLLLPFTHTVVPTVDLTGKRVIINLPDEI